MEINFKGLSFVVDHNDYQEFWDHFNNWENKDLQKKKDIFLNYLDNENNLENYVNYFEKYRIFLIKNTFKNLSKDIISL